MSNQQTFDLERSASCRNDLQTRIARWLRLLMSYPGFAEWKNEQLTSKVLYVWTDAPLPDMPDFSFPKEIETEHRLVTAYFNLISAAISTRQCAAYFRHGKGRPSSVDRKAYLQTLCELYLSRIYQFRTRLERILKQIQRQNKVALIDIDGIMNVFNDRFGLLTQARNEIHHEKDYTDLELEAIGSADLVIGMQDSAWYSVSRGRYRKIRDRWAKRVEDAADQLDLFAGVAAYYMLETCTFLDVESKSSP